MEASNWYRTLWISDVHLGIRESQAEYLLDFLQLNRANKLYLVGDIFDGWALKRSWYWPASHSAVMKALLEQAQDGVDITYVPGNHDEVVRDFPGANFGGITVRPRALHTTALGQRLLVLHGDEFDGIVRHAPWLSLLGASAYQATLKINRWFNHVRGWWGLPYWSLSAYLKHKTKRAVQFIASFERAVARKARTERVDGVVCGHIHHAELRMIDGILYANTGDWVESCTALAEHPDGQLEILRWLPMQQQTTSRKHAAWGDGQQTEAPPSLTKY